MRAGISAPSGWNGTTRLTRMMGSITTQKRRISSRLGLGTACCGDRAVEPRDLAVEVPEEAQAGHGIGHPLLGLVVGIEADAEEAGVESSNSARLAAMAASAAGRPRPRRCRRSTSRSSARRRCRRRSSGCRRSAGGTRAPGRRASGWQRSWVSASGSAESWVDTASVALIGIGAMLAAAPAPRRNDHADRVNIARRRAGDRGHLCLGFCGRTLAKAARAAGHAGLQCGGLRPGQRHSYVLRSLWRGRPGAADPWRPRPCRYLGQPGPRT